MIWGLIVIAAVLFGIFVFANFRCYTSYTMNSKEAWNQWELWKKQLEQNNFDIELCDIVQHGTYTDFYYKAKKKKQ